MNFVDKHGAYILKAYEQEDKSVGIIATELNTYPNKIRRTLIKLGANMRNKSEAQSLALSSGRHSHPTKGKKRPQNTKNKISDGVHNYWQNLDEETYQKRVDAAQEQWYTMSELQRENLRKAAGDGVRLAAKEGSKMERFLVDALSHAGYQVVFHKTGLVSNSDLEVDLFIPTLKVVIEIDGPAHFFPIWGEENLQKHIRADAEKNGLLLSNGYIVIRVKHLTKNISQKNQRDVFSSILNTLNKIADKRPIGKNRYIELEIV